MLSAQSPPCDLRSPPRVPRPHALNWQPQAPRAAAGAGRGEAWAPVCPPVALSPGAQSRLDSGPAPCRPVCCLLRRPLTSGPLRLFRRRSAEFEFAGGIGLTGCLWRSGERWAVYPALWALPASRLHSCMELGSSPDGPSAESAVGGFHAETPPGEAGAPPPPSH